MNTTDNKLPLLKKAMSTCWSSSSTRRDRVAIVVYAGASGLVLPVHAGRHGQ